MVTNIITVTNNMSSNESTNNKSKLTFYGGAGTVTGANFMLETGTKTILVDCGI